MFWESPCVCAHFVSELVYVRPFTPVQVSSLVSRCPQLLGYGVDAMESKVVFLEKVGDKATAQIPVLVAVVRIIVF